MYRFRNFLIFLLFLSLNASLVYGINWQEKFYTSLQNGQIDDGVREAVIVEKKPPSNVIQVALQVEEFKSDEQKRKHLIKALFCNIAYPEHVQRAALKNGFTEQEVWQGYQWAIDECRRQLEEWYNFSPSEEAHPTGKASPWNFQQD